MSDKKCCKLRDISIVIPTYNRPEDLKKTIESIKPFLSWLNEVLVVDQSKNNKTRLLLQEIRNKKIKYVFSKTPSITIARNLGVKNANKKSRIILFLDDDVRIEKNYFLEILRVFNEKPEAMAAAAYFEPEKINRLENLARKLFLIRNLEKNKARIISAYGNTYPGRIDRIIGAQWLPGVNMAYKREVFREQKFDENFLGYAIAEDTGFSYQLWKNHPGSIFITPFAKIIHRASQIEREPTERMAYINQIDHFYFNYKMLNKTLLDKIKFFWCLLGISILRTANFLAMPKKKNYLKLKFFFKSLGYCLKNREKIKSGRLRDFSL